MGLNPEDFLQRDQRYTITLEPAGFMSYIEHPDIGTLTSALQGMANLSQPTLTIGNVKGFGGTDYYYVSFIYAGDGADTVAGIYQEIADSFSNAVSVHSWNFVGANTGAAGTPQEDPGKIDPGLIPDSSWIWGFVAIAVLALFVYTGGATATRHALA
jgi:hypothetical protein